MAAQLLIEGIRARSIVPLRMLPGAPLWLQRSSSLTTTTDGGTETVSSNQTSQGWSSQRLSMEYSISIESNAASQRGSQEYSRPMATSDRALSFANGTIPPTANGDLEESCRRSSASSVGEVTTVPDESMHLTDLPSKTRTGVHARHSVA